MLPEGGITERTVRGLTIERIGDLVRIEITADGFLHHMVRTIVGTLVECGWGKREANEIEATIAARDRAAAGHNAPPQGLYLAGVRYDGGYDSFAEPHLFLAREKVL
jgi:tRNA pseudouridine38-40 synthase